MVHSLMSKFSAPKYITNEATKKTTGAAELMKVDVLDKKIHIAKVQVGAKATTEMKNLGALEKKKTVTVMVGFLESCTKYLFLWITMLLREPSAYTQKIGTRNLL